MKSRAWPVIAWELRRRRWSILWWIVGIGAFLTLTLLVYPTFRDQAAQIDQSLSSIPDSAKSLFSDTNDLLSPIGYLSSQIYYLMMPLLLSFLSIGLGTSLIARDESDHTIELLLSRPLSRSKLLLSKAGAGLLVVLIVGLAMAGLAAVEVALIGFAGVSAASVFAVTMMCVLMAMLFGTLAYALTAMGSFGRGLSIALAVLVALASYLFSSLAGTVKWLAWPAKVLPFHYYQPAQILRGDFSWAAAGGYVAVMVVLIFVALVAFRRRDLV